MLLLLIPQGPAGTGPSPTVSGLDVAASLADVVKCTVYLADYREFAAMNKVYAEFFGEAKPARTTVEAQMVMPPMRIEIDCVAYQAG